MGARFSGGETAGVPIHVISAETADAWIDALDPPLATWARANRFRGALGSSLVVPDASGGVASVLAGWGNAADRARGRLHFGALVGALPAGTYRIAEGLTEAELSEAALAWLLASYRFGRYKSGGAPPAELIAPPGIDAARVERIAAGVARTADLVNTPASDLGPEGLEAAAAELATAYGAEMSVTRGDALLSENLSMIHTVGRAAAEAPRLLDLSWGPPDAPKVTLVGKGVTFDTGGLNLKPGSSMALMKKDMGGAANVLGLADMIMSSALPIRLRVLVPAVENAVSAGAFRPGDVLTSRKGLTVEINNTDAEGRLVLADALTLGAEEAPELMISMATLTGAARVALGPDLAPFFTDDEALAAEIA
ncbi:MAG: leucyl aminopeptidase family protein, partial [Pseudomonadota bacterium]